MNDRPLVIFGAGQIAELADYYFGLDGGRAAAAFCVDDEFVEGDTFLGRPVIARTELARAFPPASADAFVAVAYGEMNRLRERVCIGLEADGYSLASYVSPRATVFPGVTWGPNAFILEDNTVQPFVRIGRGVTLWSGNHIGHHSTVGDFTFIASHIVIGGGVEVGKGVFMGMNATVRDHISVGDHTLVGAGALLLTSTAPQSIYPASPTRPSGRSSFDVRRI